MKKRLFTWFLTLVMVLGLLPTSVMAADEDVVYISASYDLFPKISNELYVIFTSSMFIIR